METATNYMAAVGVVSVCVALGLSRAAFYRRKGGREALALGQGIEGATAPATASVVVDNQGPARHDDSRHSSPRALSHEERAQVLAALHEPRFCDLSPAEVYATLLDEKRYLCSEVTVRGSTDRQLAAPGSESRACDDDDRFGKHESPSWRRAAA